MPVIDADAHVIETPQTWSYMRDDEQEFRPQVFLRDPNDGAPYRKGQRHQYWLIEGKVQSKGSNVGQDVPSEAASLADIARRLAHMDEVSIDAQVLYPSLFLRPLTTHHDVELALVRSYNRWLAETWRQSHNRLRWVAAPPILSLVDTGKVRAELEFCKANGACGVFMRGFECERFINDRYFWPLFEIAQELDLAVCFHAGNNSFANHDSYERDLGIMIFKFPVMGAFLYLLGDEIPKRYPKLRWAFVEASAQWVPYMLGEAKMRLKGRGLRWSDSILSDNHFYITCQKSDDTNWLVSEIGDDNLIIGTDYGHKDVAVEIEALKRLGTDGALSAASVSKILESNPGKLYGLA